MSDFSTTEPIHAYSRARAIEDGVLVDVSTVAREAGIKYPVAVSAAAWARCVAVPDGVRCQDEAGRLWDVVWMLGRAMAKAAGCTITYRLHVRNDNRDRTPPLVTLEAVCGPGDDPSPVITVMLPGEDRPPAPPRETPQKYQTDIDLIPV